MSCKTFCHIWILLFYIIIFFQLVLICLFFIAGNESRKLNSKHPTLAIWIFCMQKMNSGVCNCLCWRQSFLRFDDHQAEFVVSCMCRAAQLTINDPESLFWNTMKVSQVLWVHLGTKAFSVNMSIAGWGIGLTIKCELLLLAAACLIH